MASWNDVKMYENGDKIAPIAKRFTSQQIAQAVLDANGITAGICRLLDSTPVQWRDYIRKFPKVKQLQEEARSQIVDKAEQAVVDLLSSEDEQIKLKAAELVLKRLGKDRGWSEIQPAQQIDIRKDGTVTISQIFGISNDEQ